MSIEDFLNRVRQGEQVAFEETQALIARHYRYTPVGFTNGVGRDVVENEAGCNEGSCKIFSFARLHGLDKDTTLNLFGDFYRVDVLQNPDRDDHPNIRKFLKYGWEGIHFGEPALTPLEPS